MTKLLSFLGRVVARVGFALILGFPLLAAVALILHDLHQSPLTLMVTGLAGVLTTAGFVAAALHS